MSTAAQLVAKCLAVRTAAHYAHFQTRSYARHVALNDFYDALLDAVDEFAEVCMGLEGSFDSLPSAPVPSGQPLEFIRELVRWLESNRSAAAAAGHTALENIVDNITALSARAIYKLETLR